MKLKEERLSWNMNEEQQTLGNFFCMECPTDMVLNNVIRTKKNQTGDEYPFQIKKRER